MFYGARAVIFDFARKNRAVPTHAESLLWERYFRHKPNGIKFRRQHPIGNFIADFYCHRLKLVIEIDGSIHNLEEVAEQDRRKEDFLEQAGVKVLRFTNYQVEHDFSAVIQAIEAHF